MDCTLYLRKRIADLGFASIGRAPRRASRVEGTRRILRLEGLEERCLLSGVSSIIEYPVNTAGANPMGIAMGPDGNLWFTESVPLLQDRDDQSDDPRHHRVHYPYRQFRSDWITAGPDGNLWFTESLTQKIGMINPTAHVITDSRVSSSGIGPRGITAGPDGNLWFADSGGSDRRDQPDHPCPYVFHRSQRCRTPYGITAGPDGNLWFTENLGGGWVGVSTWPRTSSANLPYPTATPLLPLTTLRPVRTATSGSPQAASTRSVRSTLRLDAITRFHTSQPPIPVPTA